MTSENIRDGFYVTLSSENTRGYGERNKPYEFVNELFCPLKFPDNSFEVALTDIEYSLYHPRYLGSKLADGQVKFEIETPALVTVRFEKQTDDVSSWFTYANTLLTTGGEIASKLSIGINYQRNRIVITNSGHTTHWFSLDPNLSEALGFTKTEFRGETSVGSVPPSTELFENLSNDEQYLVRFYDFGKSVEFNFLSDRDLIEEPLETVGDLISAFNEVFLLTKIGDQDLDHYVQIAVEGNQISVDPKPGVTTKYSFQLSREFNNWLGLKDNFKFKNKSYKFTPYGLAFKVGKLSVFMEGVGDWFSGSTVAPLVRRFQPSLMLNVHQEMQFSNRYYVPLNTNCLSYIKMYINDETGERATFLRQTLKATLHFRRKL